MSIFRDPFLGIESVFIDNHTYYIESILMPTNFSMLKIRVTDGMWVTEHAFDRFELEHIDRNAFKSELVRLHHKMRADHPGYRHPGPTNQELDDNPALSLAWQEFLTIYRLTAS